MSKVIYHWHHIIPRHAGGTDEPNNLVRLTIPEHAEAHRLLWEQHGRIQDKLAWLMLSGKKEESEAARIELMGTPEVRAKISASRKGKIRSKEHCENLSKALTGKKQTPEHIAKSIAARKGRVLNGWNKRTEEDKKQWSENIHQARQKKWDNTSMEERQEMSRKMNERQLELGSWKKGVEAARLSRNGKKDSEELKHKKREAQKAFWQTNEGKLLRKKMSQTRQLNKRMKNILAPTITICSSKT